ncbi:hypothetical protein [Microbispora hainanensis]|uniref:hypothetical protein n=1 Tax=Microbispora hainanensis TaxID=568844 RepID=UPI0033D46DD1
MDAYRELQQFGHFGQLGLEVVFRLMREEVRRFPVLEPGSGWTEDSVWDWVQSFFVARGHEVTAAVLAQTADLPSMGRYLRRSIRNFLVSEARKTPAGSVRRKIEDLLAATPKFGQVPRGTPGAGRWQLVDAQCPPYAGELGPLVAAAYSVPGVRAVRWSGERRSPLASDESLIAILEAVFAAASGSLEIAELTQIFLQRFPAAVEFADTALDQLAFDQAVAPFKDRPDVLVEVGARAQEVYDQLSPSQRALLPHLDKPVSDHMQMLGVGRSQAYEAARRLKAALGELVPEDDLRGNVMLEVLRLCLISQ